MNPDDQLKRLVLLLVLALAGCGREVRPTVVTYPGQTVGGDWWQPGPGTRWQWQLSLFDTPAEVIRGLQVDGRVVVCYFSAGSWEDWRPDAGDFPPEVVGRALTGWVGERWLDIRQVEQLAPIMAARLDLAVEKGCDGVEPDNVDGYQNNSGFPLEYDDQLVYNRWLAGQAHERGLSIGLKNDLEQVADLVAEFDWALNEECFAYDECERLLPFITAGKAVFGVEYELQAEDFCPQANAMGFSCLQKHLELDEWRVDCRD